jgi:hypothetical protein
MSEEPIAPSVDQSAPIEEQTLTLDGVVYRMSDVPADGILFLNDLIRCENEANEHRFRLRQLAAAQQSLTAAIKQIVDAANISPIHNEPGSQDGDEDQLAA